MSADFQQASLADLCTSRGLSVSVLGFIILFSEAWPLSPKPYVRKRIITKLMPLSGARKRATEIQLAGKIVVE
jgi:hypothetical protein